MVPATLALVAIISTLVLASGTATGSACADTLSSFVELSRRGQNAAALDSAAADVAAILEGDTARNIAGNCSFAAQEARIVLDALPDVGSSRECAQLRAWKVSRTPGERFRLSLAWCCWPIAPHLPCFTRFLALPWVIVLVVVFPGYSRRSLRGWRMRCAGSQFLEQGAFDISRVRRGRHSARFTPNCAQQHRSYAGLLSRNSAVFPENAAIPGSGEHAERRFHCPRLRAQHIVAPCNQRDRQRTIMRRQSVCHARHDQRC